MNIIKTLLLIVFTILVVVGLWSFLLAFILFICSIIALYWVFGGRIVITQNDVKIGYVKWFKFYPYADIRLR